MTASPAHRCEALKSRIAQKRERRESTADDFAKLREAKLAQIRAELRAEKKAKRERAAAEADNYENSTQVYGG